MRVGAVQLNWRRMMGLYSGYVPTGRVIAQGVAMTHPVGTRPGKSLRDGADTVRFPSGSNPGVRNVSNVARRDAFTTLRLGNDCSENTAACTTIQ